MPAFCRVAATLTPTSDSDIGIEVWMPAWLGMENSRVWETAVLQDDPLQCDCALEFLLGYATVGTDTGHVGSSSDGSFAFGHPEKIIDFGYRSIHLMTVIGKQISSAFYGEDPKHSYFTGCSTGGRQALMEAQRFSNDYDGIVAGDPVAYYTHHHVGGNLWVVWQMFNNPASTVFTTQDTLLGNAVNAACDALDGVVDGVLNDPRRCHFDPGRFCAKDRKCLRAALQESRSKQSGICGLALIRRCSSGAIIRPLRVAAKPTAGQQRISPEPPPEPQTDDHAQIGFLSSSTLSSTIRIGIFKLSTGFLDQLTSRTKWSSRPDLGVGSKLD